MSAVYTQERLKAMAESRRAEYCMHLSKRITNQFFESPAFVNFRPWTHTYTLEFEIEPQDLLTWLRKTFPDISLSVYPDGIDTDRGLPRMAVWIRPAIPKGAEDA
jgi:hypothetical protein